jgi:hypothetical protein
VAWLGCSGESRLVGKSSFEAAGEESRRPGLKAKAAGSKTLFEAKSTGLHSVPIVQEAV